MAVSARVGVKRVPANIFAIISRSHGLSYIDAYGIQSHTFCVELVPAYNLGVGVVNQNRLSDACTLVHTLLVCMHDIIRGISRFILFFGGFSTQKLNIGTYLEVKCPGLS